MSNSYEFDIGFLGGGQLARMSIQAAQRMGLRCLALDPTEDCPASQISPALVGSLSDVEAVSGIFSQCAKVTLENEFIPASVIQSALRAVGREESCLVPSLASLAIIQDKYLQRQALVAAGVPGPTSAEVAGDGELAIAKIGFPMVLKARFGGYDGKGTRYANSPDEFENLRNLWGDGGWIAESFVKFKREIAVMVFITEQGAGTFPTMETFQTDHVCDTVQPCDADGSKIALDAVRAVGGNGLYGVELFELETGELLVNEIAPRPHNTGHYTLDWGGPSQFDHHIRLVTDLTPAPIDGLPTCMVNLLGQAGAKDWQDGLAAAINLDPAVRVHWYGKSESKPGRKMGHINVCGSDCVERAKAARTRFYAAWVGNTTVPEEVG